MEISCNNIVEQCFVGADFYDFTSYSGLTFGAYE